MNSVEDWPEPEPAQPPVAPEEFTRATKLDQPQRPGGVAADAAAASAAAFHHTTEAWPEPETPPATGDFTRGSINESTLNHITEKATLRDSRPDWRFRDYGQWKPAPASILAPIIAVLIVAAIILLIPTFTSLDVLAETAAGLWQARIGGEETFTGAAAAAPKAAAVALLTAAAAAWHIRTAIGVARGSRAALISARIITATWTFLGLAILTENLSQSLSLQGGATAMWAFTALTFAAFALTWAKQTKQWCRKTLRAAA